jgi:signal transduction histidine kinase
VIKGVTAAASILTAILLIRLVPQALDLPSPQQWLFANAALQKEVQDRRELELNLRIENRSVEWRVEPLPEVDCDPGLLKLVFNNLLGNALKFTAAASPL